MNLSDRNAMNRGEANERALELVERIARLSARLSELTYVADECTPKWHEATMLLEEAVERVGKVIRR
jgi:hypothetical protein